MLRELAQWRALELARLRAHAMRPHGASDTEDELISWFSRGSDRAAQLADLFADVRPLDYIERHKIPAFL